MRATVLLLSVLLVAGWLPQGATGQEAKAKAGEHLALAAELAADAPGLVTRAEWKAKQPLPGMKPQTPVSIIIHHTGVAQNGKVALERKMQNLQEFSQEYGQVSPKRSKPPWPDVPYHYYIDLEGRIAEGRSVLFAGDTNTPYNTSGHIQIVLEGDFEKEMPAPKQLGSLHDLMVWVSLSWNISPARVSTHKDHAQTTCPGRNFLPHLKGLLAAAAEERQKSIVERCAARPGKEFARTYCRRT